MIQRVRVEYDDQNEAFASMLPRSGELVGRYGDVHGNSDWFRVRLDTPLEYQEKVGEPYQFRLLNVTDFLIRSRSATHALGTADSVPVFILLVNASQKPVPNPFDPSAYVHVAWGLCMVEK